MESMTLEPGTRRRIRVAMANSGLFSPPGMNELMEIDALCIDFDECVEDGAVSEALAWVEQGNLHGKQVFLIASRRSLDRFPAVMSRECTLVEKVDSLEGLSGAVLAHRLSDLLEEVYAPLEGNRSANPIATTNDMPRLETPSSNRDPQKIDPVYLQRVLSPDQEDQLLAFLRLPEGESDPSNPATD